MKKLLNFLLCAVAIVALGACNNNDDENGGGIEQQIQGNWMATRQTVTVKINGTTVMEEDDVLEIEDGLGFAFTSGKQLFGLEFIDLDGTVKIENHFYVGQWSITADKKLKIAYIDNGGLDEDDILAMGDVFIESVNDKQLVLKMSMVEDMDGQKAEVTALCYFTRSNIEFNVGSLVE